MSPWVTPRQHSELVRRRTRRKGRGCALPLAATPCRMLRISLDPDSSNRGPNPREAVFPAAPTCCPPPPAKRPAPASRPCAPSPPPPPPHASRESSGLPRHFGALQTGVTVRPQRSGAVVSALGSQPQGPWIETTLRQLGRAAAAHPPSPSRGRGAQRCQAGKRQSRARLGAVRHFNDPGRTQACNPRLCGPMPYPLGHGASRIAGGHTVTNGPDLLRPPTSNAPATLVIRAAGRAGGRKTAGRGGLRWGGG